MTLPFYHIILCLTMYSVLRTEQGADAEAVVVEAVCGDVPELTVDRGGIADEADPPALQAVRGEEAFDSECDRHEAPPRGAASERPPSLRQAP